MRRWVSVPVAIMLLSALPVAGQEKALLLEEEAGDVVVETTGGQSVSQVQDRFDHVDLRSLEVEESPDAFTFRLAVASLAIDQDNFLFEHADWRIHFWHEGVHYGIDAYRYPDLEGGATYYAYVGVVREDSDFLDSTGAVGIEADEETGVLTLTVDRDDIPGENGAAPFPGRALTDFFVEAHTSSGTIYINSNEPLVGFTAEDRMPDDGVGPAFDVLLGIEQSELASLTSPEPMRISNGGATTVVFDLEAANTDDQRHTFALSLSDVPQGWEVSLPFKQFSLDANETRSFPILLVTPSGHSHGGIDTFRLDMVSERDERAFGQIELGLRYTEIPQPAGHHPKMWFHSFPTFDDPFFTAINAVLPFGQPVYMNAAEGDPTDSEEPTPANGNPVTGLESEVWWHVYMSPDLRMGLDFDMDGTGTLEVPVHYLYLMQDATLSGTLYLYDPGAEETVVLGDIMASEPVSVGPDETHTFELTLQPTSKADFVAYETGMQMWMELRMRGVPLGPGPFGPETNPTLAPGGWIELPLNEYRDPVSTFYRAVEGLSFAKEFIEEDVNPGETRVFRVAVENAGDDKETVDLNLTGTHLDWARILGKTSFDLASGAAREVAVAVEIPDGIEDGAVVDLALVASSQDNPFRRAVVDLVAVVDTEEDHPDDAAEAGKLDEELAKGKKSPGFEVAAVMAILAAVVLVLLRRRQ